MRIALLVPLALIPAVVAAQTPALDVAPGRLSYIAVAGSRAPVPQQVRIRVIDSAPIPWQAVPSAPWIRVDPPSGTTPDATAVGIDASRLGAGSYTGRVTISAVGGRGFVPVVVEVSVQIAARRPSAPPAAPAAVEAPPSRPAGRPAAAAPAGPRLDLSAPEGSTRTIESSVTLDSPPDGPAEWFARPDRTWLTVEPVTGMTPARLIVRADPTGLGPGVHRALLRFVDDARDPMLEVPVTLTIGSPAPPAAQPLPAPAAQAEAAATPPPEDPPAATPLTISVDALAPALRSLPYSQVIPVTGGRPPYTIRLVNGRLPAGLGLANGAISGVTRYPGTYPLGLVASDSSVPAQTTAKTVTLSVIVAYRDTMLTLTHASVSLVVNAGQQARGVAVGVASGAVPLGWTVSGDRDWLLISPTRGTSPGVVRIGVDAAGLAPGQHAATLTVTMEGAPNSPMRIPVLAAVRR